MSAPKPKVFQAPDGQHWHWTCDCGVESRWWSKWSHALIDARGHSRTHTAERVAEHLAERSWDELDNADRGLSRDRHTGRAYAFAKSAHLIRQHLVKEIR